MMLFITNLWHRWQEWRARRREPIIGGKPVMIRLLKL